MDNKTKKTLSIIVKKAREEKGISARKLAELCNISHTEINNIEKGVREKPALLTLKYFEKYLDIPFSESAQIAGYSDQTVKNGKKKIYVTYDMFDKEKEEHKQKSTYMLRIIDKKTKIGLDLEKEFNYIYNYLLKQDNINPKIIEKAKLCEKYINELSKKEKNNSTKVIIKKNK